MNCRHNSDVTNKSALLRIGLAWSVVVLTSGCPDNAQTRVPATTVTQAVVEQQAIFSELSHQAGLRFEHNSGANGVLHMPEIIGSGVAIFDYDADGDLDVFFSQATEISNRDAQRPAVTTSTRGNRMFKNRLSETGTLQFVDVTADTNLDMEMYGMGVAVSDYDNDGDPDLYVLGYRDNLLYKNNAGAFESVTDAGGARDDLWGSSASFCDVNNDQWPDLYIANYLNYQPAQKVICKVASKQEDYCSPNSYTPVPDRLFRNNQDGTFSDISSLWGINTVSSPGLGVLCRDFNQDGYMDIYVANDGKPNHLWINKNGRYLVDEAEVLGAAINMYGQTEGSMGVAAGDFDFDGDDDLFMTHWNNETNTIYRNDGDIGFMDITTTVNLASPSKSHTGFGTDWIDYDNDGDLDVFVANGAVQLHLDKSGAMANNYGQDNQLFRNDDGKRFTDVSKQAGANMQALETGRGAAFGDIDNDGDTDVIVTNKDGPARLYINNVGQNNNWLGLILQGTRSNRDALGARIRLTRSDGKIIWRVVRRDGSYQSASDPRILIGLGKIDDLQDVELHWPKGDVQKMVGLEPNRYHQIIEP